MKKLLILSLVTCKLLFANDMVLLASNPTYKEALSAYESKEYLKALSAFERLSSSMPTNPEAHFYVGLCALELKDYNSALAAFERVLMLNPSHTRTHLELARAYYEMKSYQLANTQLDTALQDALPDTVKQSVMGFKAQIDEHLTRHFFSGALSIGLGYDSNANNDVGNIQFIVPSFNVTVPGNEEKSDTFLSSSVYLNHLYDIGEKGDWTLATSGIVYGKLNHHFHSNNVSLFSLTTKPTFTQEQYKISLPVGIDQVYLDGANYAHIVQAGIEGVYLIDKQSTLSSTLMLKRSYYDEDDTLDAKTQSLGIKYRRALYDNSLFLTVGTSYENNQEVSSARTDVAGNAWTHKLELSKELFKDALFSISYAYTSKKFDDIDLSFLSKREDKQNNYGIGLSYTLAKDMFINASLNYLDQSSNHAPFSYDKTTFGINFLKSF